VAFGVFPPWERLDHTPDLDAGAIRGIQCRVTNEYPRTIAGMNRTLIIIGVTLLIIGLLWKPLSALPLFRLPGDFVINRPGFRFYFPLTSMILISAVVSLILWLFRR
jgi:hypothetical protein